MILFNYEKIWLLSLGRPDLMLRYFKWLYLGYPEYETLKGSNFIVNPEVIIKNPYKLSDIQLSEYLGLCALRNYSEYKLSGEVDLEMEYFPPWIPKQVVEQNPLIAINKSKIIFIKEKTYD